MSNEAQFGSRFGNDGFDVPEQPMAPTTQPERRMLSPQEFLQRINSGESVEEIADSARSQEAEAPIEISTANMPEIPENGPMDAPNEVLDNLLANDVPEFTLTIHHNSEISEIAKAPRWLKVGGVPSGDTSVSFYVRPLTYAMVKDLSYIDEVNSHDLIKRVLQEFVLVFGESSKRYAIKGPDAKYLLLYIRHNTYADSGFDLEYDCLHCKAKTKTSVPIEDMDVQFLESEAHSVLSLGGDSVLVEVPALERMNLFDDFLTLADPDHQDTPDLAEDLLVACHVKSVGGREMSVRDSLAYIRDLDFGDVAKLFRAVTALTCGVKDKAKAKCTSCKRENPLKVNLTDLFFLPSL